VRHDGCSSWKHAVNYPFREHVVTLVEKSV
jgi:hypothetical protein